MENKIIYQVYPKSFKDSNHDGVGDLQGIIEKLEYLSDLGIDYLWLSPINTSPQHDNGYDISDYYSIDPAFGSLQDYQQLIQEAKQWNIKIMMDLVLNHTSIEHQWFQKAIAGDTYYQNFYFFRDQPTDDQSIFGGSAWQFIPSINQYYLCFFDKTQADLNWDNPDLRNELFNMINYWIDFGVEAFRLDVIEYISKDIDQHIFLRGPRLLEYIRELSLETFKNQFLTVGECWQPSLHHTQQICHEDGLFQAFHFEDITHTHNPDKWNLSPFDLNKLMTIMEKWQNNYTGTPAWAMNNHDNPRLISLWLNDTQYRYESATLLISLYCMLRGNLYLFQGEEIGMTNAYQSHISWYNDIETLNAYKEMKARHLQPDDILSRIMKVSRDNARVGFPWNNQEHGGFSSVTPWLGASHNYLSINVDNDLNQNSRSIYQYYQNILTLRKKFYPSIIGSTIFKEHQGIMTIEYPDYTFYGNFTDKQQRLSLPIHSVLISNYEQFSFDTILPYQTIIYKHSSGEALK
nr:alpha-amylase family glycosyl hydrolase [Entomospira entomophilus]